MTMLRTAVAERISQGFTAWTTALALTQRKLFEGRRAEDTAPVLALGDCLHPLD